MSMLSKRMVGAFDIDKLRESFSTQLKVDTTSQVLSGPDKKEEYLDTYHRNYLQVSM